MRGYGKSGKRQSSRSRLGAALAVSALLLSAGPRQASAGKPSPDSGWVKGIDTAWHSPFPNGMRPGLRVSPPVYLRGDSLWSSPYEVPATPGTGLPGKPGYGWPATGYGNGSGTGGSGEEGIGIPRDSSRAPRTGPSPASPGDTIGVHEWMERG